MDNFLSDNTWLVDLIQQNGDLFLKAAWLASVCSPKHMCFSTKMMATMLILALGKAFSLAMSTLPIVSLDLTNLNFGGQILSTVGDLKKSAIHKLIGEQINRTNPR